MRRFLHISVPKAGTHLTQRIFELHPDLRWCDKFPGAPPGPTGFVGWETPAPDPHEPQLVNGVSFPVTASMRWFEERLDAIGPGEWTICAHLPYSDAAAKALAERDFALIITIRDPRDVAVSALHYQMDEPSHVHHDYLAALPDDDARLEAIICGLPPVDFGNGRRFPQPGIADQFRSVMRWWVRPMLGFTPPTRCVVTYEDLVGPDGGGGSEDARRTAIWRALYLIGVSWDAETMRYITKHLYGESRTFRRGKVGAWREEMSPANQQLFKALGGQVLIDLGYETGLDW